MTILPAPPHQQHDSYFRTLEPHYFRFAEENGEARLNLHDEETDRYLGVYIVVEYKQGPEMYGNLPLAWDSIPPFMDWWARQDEKDF